MPRQKKSNPPTQPPADAATWFGPRQPLPPKPDDKIHRALRKIKLPERQGPRPSKGRRATDPELQVCPPYLASIRKVNLSAHDWRRLMLFLLRRLYQGDRNDRKRALQFAWDVRFFEMLRLAQRERAPNDLRWVAPRDLLAWLKYDEPLARGYTAPQALRVVWDQWYRLLCATPRSKWPDLPRYFSCEEELKSSLEKVLKKESTNKRKTIASVARELTAIQASTKDSDQGAGLSPDSVRVMLSRAGLATWTKPPKRSSTSR